MFCRYHFRWLVASVVNCKVTSPCLTSSIVVTELDMLRIVLAALYTVKSAFMSAKRTFISAKRLVQHVTC